MTSTAITTNSSGARVTELRYFAYGGTRYDAGGQMTIYRYTGQRIETGTGLYDYGARWYDPQIGRFLAPDSIVPNVGSSQSLNRYAYVSGNPLKYTDPSGHWLESAIDIAFIIYDIHDIATNGLSLESGAALALDVGGLLLPVVTGAGLLARAAGHADDVVRAVSHTDEIVDVATHADEAAAVVRQAENAAELANRASDTSEVQRATRNWTRGENSTTRAGREAHNELQARVEAKPGWQWEPRLQDPLTGRIVKPDALTPSGRPIELKPDTPSGHRAGQAQMRKYERATGKRGRVIYYTPE